MGARRRQRPGRYNYLLFRLLRQPRSAPGLALFNRRDRGGGFHKEPLPLVSLSIAHRKPLWTKSFAAVFATTQPAI